MSPLLSLLRRPFSTTPYYPLKRLVFPDGHPFAPIFIRKDTPSDLALQNTFARTIYSVPFGLYSFYYLFLLELNSTLHMGGLTLFFLAGKMMNVSRQLRNSTRVQSVHLNNTGTTLILGFYNLEYQNLQEIPQYQQHSHLLKDFQGEENQQYIAWPVHQLGSIQQTARGYTEQTVAWLEQKLAPKEDTRVNRYNQWDQKKKKEEPFSGDDVYQHLEDHIQIRLSIDQEQYLEVQIDLGANTLSHLNDYLSALSLGRELEFS